MNDSRGPCQNNTYIIACSKHGMNQVHQSNLGLSNLAWDVNNIYIIHGVMTFRTRQGNNRPGIDQTNPPVHRPSVGPSVHRPSMTEISQTWCYMGLESPSMGGLSKNVIKTKLILDTRNRDNHSCLIKYFSKTKQGFVKTL